MDSKQDKKAILETAKSIRTLRLKKGLLQTEVAKKAGLNSNYYAKVERGEAKPSWVTITKIIKGLGAKASDIL